jgi:hypothetical protein
MLEEYKTRMKYDKLFSFMIGKMESQSLKLIINHGYNVSAILRKSINDVADKIIKNEKQEKKQHENRKY